MALLIAAPIHVALTSQVIGAMASGIALPDHDVLLLAIAAAYLASLGVRIAAGIHGALASVQQQVIRLILASYEVSARVVRPIAVYVVNHRTFGQWMADRTLDYQNVLENLAVSVPSGMFRRLDQHVPRRVHRPALPAERTPARAMAEDEPLRLSLDIAELPIGELGYRGQSAASALAIHTQEYNNSNEIAPCRF